MILIINKENCKLYNIILKCLCPLQKYKKLMANNNDDVVAEPDLSTETSSKR